MIGWLQFERVWLRTLIDVILPGPIDVRPEFWAELERASPPLLRIGLRLDAWLLGSWVGLFSVQRRELYLDALSRSRFYLLRQLVFTAKLVACFARSSQETDDAHRHFGSIEGS